MPTCSSSETVVDHRPRGAATAKAHQRRMPEAPPLRCRLEMPGDAAFRLALFRETHGAVLAGLDPALAEMLLHQQLAGQAMTYAARYPAARAEIVEHGGLAVGAHRHRSYGRRRHPGRHRPARRLPRPRPRHAPLGGPAARGGGRGRAGPPQRRPGQPGAAALRPARLRGRRGGARRTWRCVEIRQPRDVVAAARARPAGPRLEAGGRGATRARTARPEDTPLPQDHDAHDGSHGAAAAMEAAAPIAAKVSPRTRSSRR